MSILTEIQKTAANADEKIKHLYETAFPEGEKMGAPGFFRGRVTQARMTA